MDVNGFIFFNSHFVPREILTHILHFVDLRRDIFQCRSVCRIWNDIITGELWKKKLAEQKNFKSFSTMSVKEKYSLNYPWFLFHEIFLNDSFSRNLMENSIDVGSPTRKQQLVDLRKCSISNVMMDLRPKIIINVRIPAEIDNDSPFQYRVNVKLFNKRNAKLRGVTHSVTCHKNECQFTMEIEMYFLDGRYLEIVQVKRTVSDRNFLPPNADVDIRLSAPHFCEEHWNWRLMNSGEFWHGIAKYRDQASISKISRHKKANLQYPWFVATEIFDCDPYERNLVESAHDFYYKLKNAPMKFGFWRMITEEAPSTDSSSLYEITSSSKLNLVQTICLRDRGIFGFLLDNEQPAINIKIKYPYFGPDSLFESDLYNRIKVSLLNDKEEVLQEKLIFDEAEEILEINWTFAEYGPGVRYIELCVGCKFNKSRHRLSCSCFVEPPVKVSVTLPQLRKL